MPQQAALTADEQKLNDVWNASICAQSSPRIALIKHSRR